MTKYIIIVGDSFTTDANGWPGHLADLLKLKLVCYGESGQHWWSICNFLKKLDQQIINNTEVIVFSHTYAERIPSIDTKISKIDPYDTSKKDEMSLAVQLYYKYILDLDFMKWAQEKWFDDITEKWQHIKLVNLHCFPLSLNLSKLPGGVNVKPSLASISLNEINADTGGGLVNDNRPNHFNDVNNKELARQLSKMIINYKQSVQEFDLTKFDLKTRKWDNWK